MTFRLYSNDFQDGGRLDISGVGAGNGHQGGNISPHLAWEGAPEGTKSFVLTMHDPDLPTVCGLWHWVVADIPATATELPAGAGSGKAPLPAGARQTITDIAPSGYVGPMPPPGPAHHYNFTLYALGVDKVPVAENATPGRVDLMAFFNQLGAAKLTVTYGV